MIRYVCPLCGSDGIQAEGWATIIASAKMLLKQARDLLVQAGAPKSAARVRLVMSSVRGALANVKSRQLRPARKRIRRAPKIEIATVKWLDNVSERP